MSKEKYSDEFKNKDFKRQVGREELAEIISRHEMWLADSNLGKKADLSDCFLRGHRIEQVDLRGANLLAADLMYVKMRNVKLNGANLKDANFRNTELNNVDFYRANLSGTQFDYEYLNKADLEGAFGL